ncbi:single-stranded-DNA-specific exonuclease RecJ [Paenibacillus sp. J31TS4]|uniref:single-stranded-DNA-specific exonuclease RecJ n=1 Tax=Paenibacillus sp. J31TS4 TaxID=2807195 RepID=UPI001B1E153E|nr:single-stranded-DNA-specific exonuclease RecJ [Paenibacillus sp. J31TS4]GIP39234.1 single-stranded-DNA-specific exonuclease RecJ [Paenibacillus sp. J31TS4]
MLPSRAKWTVQGMEEETVRLLADRLGLSAIAARLLVARGIRTPEQAELFLKAGAEHAHDPYLLDGMKEAVERLRQAIEQGERIRIYGDYDADGVSSTALMTHLLRGLSAKFDSYVPHRVLEGYGLNRGAIDRAKEEGVQLLVTVDTGISAWEEVAYAASLGIDVIVTDHHEPPEALPDCCAVLNPKKPGCPYPFKQLAGVGVAFKLATALLGRFPEELLEYAALGTVADLMPLTGENRILVRLGLERMRQAAGPGMQALLAVAGIDRRQVNAGHLGFSLGPRINAGGRLESADTAVRLLTTADSQEAALLAENLDALNKERQRIVEEIGQEAEAVVREDGGRPPRVLVVAREDWNVGVIGIVASRLLEAYYRPTLILSIDRETGLAKGSARSIPGFDLHAALTACADLLEHYGGHQAAAGMTVRRENLPELAARLNELAAAWLTDEHFVPVLQADLDASLSEVTLAAIQELEQLGPFGMGNPSPRFVFSDLEIRERRTMGKEQQHLKLQLTEAARESAASIEAVGFGKSAVLGRLSPAARVDVVGELSVNEWNGTRRPQLLIQDLRVPHVQVFDWRGAGRLEEKLKTLGVPSTLWADRPEDNAGPGLLLFREEELTLLPPGFTDQAAIWCRGGDGGVRCLHKGTRDHFPQVKDLILYTLPDREDTLREILTQAEGVERIYAVFRTPEGEGKPSVPGRDRFKQVYGALRALGGQTVEPRQFAASWSRRLGLPPSVITFIMEVFVELEFLERCLDGYRCHPAPGRRDLTSSALYRGRLERQKTEELLLYSSAQELHGWIVRQLAAPKLLTEA